MLREIEERAVRAAQKLVERLTLENRTLVLAESCTGGLISELVTRVSGASAVLWGSFVSYTPEAKEKMLCIDSDLLGRFGLVSRETAREMALGALRQSGASLAAAVTGLAGPLGDGSGLPPGTVWISVVVGGDSPEEQPTEKKFFFRGSRDEVRMQAATTVLEELLKQKTPKA